MQKIKSLIEVKICGLTSEKDAELIIQYGADYGGMVLFYPQSKRNIEIAMAKRLVGMLKKADIRTVAVMVSPDVSQLKEVTKAGFDFVQIHGRLENDVYLACTIPIIRAVHMKEEHFEEAEKIIEESALKSKVYGILLDAGSPGSGKTFDWRRLHAHDLSGKKMFLAGGLQPDNVRQAIKTVHPQAVDVSSGVEKDSGTGQGKDEIKVRDFIKNAKGR